MSIAAEGGEAPALLSWAGALARMLAVAVLAVVGGLVFWSVAPHLAGLQSHAVVSGSMQPQIMSGDVVLTQPLESRAVQPGQVVLFTDPGRSGSLLLHRLVTFRDNGDLVTRGDANQSADSSPVPPSDVRGLARLRVPFVGLPVLWRQQGRLDLIATVAVGFVAAIVFVSRDPVHAP